MKEPIDKSHPDYMEFIVKRVAVNPFSLDLTDVLILFDKATNEPYCDIESGERFVNEGDTITVNDITARFVSKKAKHLVPGDTVIFEDRMYQAKVKSIEWNDMDLYRSKVFLEKVELSPQGKFFEHTIISIPQIEEIELGRVSPRHWISASIICPCCKR